MKSIHIICGKCGSAEDMSFEIDLKGNCDNDGVEFPAVYMRCDNCIELTGLDDVIKEIRNIKDLGEAVDQYQWRDVKGELPEDRQTVLVRFNLGSFGVAEFYEDEKIFETTEIGCYKIVDATHWVPIPKFEGK